MLGKMIVEVESWYETDYVRQGENVGDFSEAILEMELFRRDQQN
jgi:hypothetical protein